MRYAALLLASTLFCCLPSPSLALPPASLAMARQGPAIGEPDEKTAYEIGRLQRLEGINQVSVPELGAILIRIRSRLNAALGLPGDAPAVKVEDCSGYLAWTRAFDAVRICRNVFFYAKSEDEIAWLVAHEYGHLAHRDPVRMSSGLTEPVTLNQAFWNLVSIGALIVAPPAILATPSLYGRSQTVLVNETGRRSREDEFSADSFAFHLLAKAAYNPLAGLRALACTDAQTSDCAMSADALPAPKEHRTAEKISNLIAPTGWIQASSHPSIAERSAKAIAILQTMKLEGTAFTPLPPVGRTSLAAEYRRRIDAVDMLSTRAARLFAETINSSDPARARAIQCIRQGLPQSTRELLKGMLGQDRAIRTFVQAIGLLCANDELVMAGAEFGPSSSYIGDLAAFVWRTRQQSVPGDDGAYRRLVLKYSDNETIYRELRWIGPLMERQVNFYPTIRSACQISPYVNRRLALDKGFLSGGQELKVSTFCNQTETYGPDFNAVDLQAAFWFDPLRATNISTQFWPAMMLRLNFDLHCIAHSGLALAKTALR